MALPAGYYAGKIPNVSHNAPLCPYLASHASKRRRLSDELVSFPDSGAGATGCKQSICNCDSTMQAGSADRFEDSIVNPDDGVHDYNASSWLSRVMILLQRSMMKAATEESISSSLILLTMAAACPLLKKLA